MTKRANAKYKIDRRMGENIWGRPKSPVNKREYGPGQHGQRRKGKMSDFGTQLKAKQKLKGYYANLSERQFRKVYDEAIRITGDSSENLIGLLERRLDMVVYRAKFVPTIFAARQFVSPRPREGERPPRDHRLDPPASAGDTIELTEKAKGLANVLEADPARRARHAGLHRGRPQGHDRPPDPHPGPLGRALSRPDAAEPGGGILLALTVATAKSARAAA